MPVNVVLKNTAEEPARIEAFKMPIAPDTLRGILDRLMFSPENMDVIEVSASLVEQDGGGGVTEIDNPESITQLDELNSLALLYDGLDDQGKMKFGAVLEYVGHGFSEFPHELGNIGDTIDILLNLDKFTYYYDVHSLQELGQKHVENIRQNQSEEEAGHEPEALNYRAFAEAALHNDGGCFTSHGYVAGKGKGFVPHFSISGVPEEHRIWERAFFDLPVFENPVVINYRALSEGHANEWALYQAHEVLDFLSFESKCMPYAAIDADDHTARGQQIIELAVMIQNKDEALVTMIEQAASDSSLDAFPYELIDNINDQAYGLKVQQIIERTHGIDNEFDKEHRDKMANLPQDMQFEANMNVMLANRERHQRIIQRIEEQVPPLETLSPDEKRAFIMLPADRQAAIVMEQDLYLQLQDLKLANAREMVGLYSSEITKCEMEHENAGKPSIRESLQRYQKEAQKQETAQPGGKKDEPNR